MSFCLYYVDDFILLADCPEQLLEWRLKIVEFLNERLSRRRVVNTLRERLDEFQQCMCRQLTLGTVQVEYLSCEPEPVSRLRQVLASYMGHFKHADTYTLQKSLLPVIYGSHFFFEWLTVV